MPIRSSSIALLRHLARPRAAPSLTTVAATAPPDSVASLRRELKKVKAKADEYMELYDRFKWEIFPFWVGVLLFDQLNREVSIMELKKSVAMLKEEKEEKVASMTTASSSAMPSASESEPEPTVAMLKEKEKAASATAASSSPMPASEPTITNGTSCVGGST